MERKLGCHPRIICEGKAEIENSKSKTFYWQIQEVFTIDQSHQNIWNYNLHLHEQLLRPAVYIRAAIRFQ